MPVAPLSINRYQEVPEFEDVTRVDDTIDRRAKKSLKYAAVACGCCIVTTLVTLLSVRVSISIIMPPIALYQTSLHGSSGSPHAQSRRMSSSGSSSTTSSPAPAPWQGDRLHPVEASELHRRGVNIGLLAFGNTECSKLLKFVNAGSNIIQGEGFSTDKCEPPLASESAHIRVDSSKTYQTILGFGGAFTEASAINFFKLPQSVQHQVVDLYFGPSGIGYSMGRVHINSCDFSEKSYSFDEIPGDYEMEYFDAEVTHDEAAMMPLIRLAMESAGKPLRLVASPWSPPSWMKVPMSDGRQYMNGSATPNGLKSDPRVMKSWALYISKWISAYESKGVPIWAVTPQNEPEFPAPWEACAYNESFEREWVDGYLGPAMRSNHPEKLILAFDHNKDGLLRWTQSMLGEDSRSRFVAGPSPYVDGMAFHWYGYNDDRLIDGTFGYNNVNQSYHLMGGEKSGKVLLGTEGCSCPGVKLDNWLRAERLAHDLIFDLNNFAQGWLDWNLLVDASGGPNHVGNVCDAPLVAAADFNSIHIQPKYYYFGHFSKFVPPTSVRVHSEVVGNFGFQEGLDPNMRAGVELGAFACERSSRQQWKFNERKALELRSLALDPEATDGYHARLCASPGDPKGIRPYLHVVVCDAKPVKGYSQPLKITRLGSTPQGKAGSGDMWLDEVSGKCLGLAGGVSEPGALLELQPCATSLSAFKDHQQFVFDANTGEVRVGGAGLCLTVGWPFLTGAAFRDPYQKTVIVLLNEADADTKVVLTDKEKGDVWFPVPAKGIQTVVF